MGRHMPVIKKGCPLFICLIKGGGLYCQFNRCAARAVAVAIGLGINGIGIVYGG